MLAHGYLRNPQAVRVTPPPSMTSWLGSHHAWIIGTLQWP